MSKPGRIATLILVTAVVCFSAAVFYSLRLNPEVRLSVGAARIKRNWAEKISREHPRKIIVFGGSSSNFAIDPEYALATHGVPIANLGLSAGMGALVLARFAMDEARAGDTLLVSTEAGLLASPQPSQLGIQFAYAFGRPEWADPQMEFAQPRASYRSVSSLPPSGEHVFILLGRVFARQPLFRYRIENFTQAGQQFDATRIRVVKPFSPGKLSPHFLQSLKSECERRQVRVAFLMPWQYCLPEQAGETRRKNAEFLKEMAKNIPVVEEPSLGVYTNADWVGDYIYHPNRKGAIARTESLIQALKKQEALWPAGGK